MYKAHINGDKVQSCKEHCENTAKIAAKCLENVGLSDIAYLAGMLHDAGKCTDEFNKYIEAASKGEKVNKGSVIHTFTGLIIILSKFHDYYNSNENRCFYCNLTAELIAIAIGSHHGLFDIYGQESESGFEHRFKKQPDYDKNAADNFYNECLSLGEIRKLFKKAVEETEKIYFEIAEILKESENQEEEVLFYLNVLERLLLSALIEGDRSDTANFMTSGEYKSIEFKENVWDKPIDNLLKKIDTFPQVTEIQQARREMSDMCAEFASEPAGIYRLNLPTGAGKTLSSLRYALMHAKKYNKKRIIFAIPLLSILDQNAGVIREAVGDDSIILEHHSNVVTEDESSEENLKREILTDSWDAPIIITTLVQLLNTFFDGKTSSIRRFQSLINSVVIIDEVQSVPTKMLSLFNLTLNFLSKICNTTFLLCSATQPLFELNSHKLLVDSKEIIPADKAKKYKEIFKRTDVKYIGELDTEEIVNKAEEYYQKYKSVLIVCNTKKEAYDLFVRTKSFTDNSIHLSTAMCMSHRKKVIKTMTQKLKDKEPFVCVSTQLIEAGVDVSFGAVIRLAAGIDNIAQAAGRGNRNGEQKDLSPVGVTYLKGEDLSRLKEIKLSKDVTGELISEYKKDPNQFENDLISDESIKFYYKTLFRKINGNKNSTDYCVQNGTLMDFLSQNKKYTPEDANHTPEDANQFTMRQAFKTAGEQFEVFDNLQKSIIVPYGDGSEIINDILSDRFKNDLWFAKKKLKEAKEYIVNLYDYQVDKLNESHAIYSDDNKTVLILNPEFYDENLGVITEKGEESEWSTQIL